jgi:sporulation protein YqfC
MSKKIKLTKRNLKQKMKNNLEDCFDSFKKCGSITLYDNKEIYIDGCYGIAEITEEKIKISIGNRFVEIMGRNFDIKDYTDKSITICGKIDTLEFCSRG